MSSSLPIQSEGLCFSISCRSSVGAVRCWCWYGCWVCRCARWRQCAGSGPVSRVRRGLLLQLLVSSFLVTTSQETRAPKLLLTDKKIKTVGAGRGLNDFLQLSQHTKDLLNIFYCLKFDIIDTAILELDIRTILKYFLLSRYIFK